jgi:D-2-hydroxyacid dehydrogenase (NADP+)
MIFETFPILIHYSMSLRKNMTSRSSIQRRYISFLTCIDRSVFPTAPWREMERAATSLTTTNTNTHVNTLSFNKEKNKLDLPDSNLMHTCEALVIGTRDEQLLEKLLDIRNTPNLKWIHCLAAGVDQLPYTLLRSRAATDKDFTVTHHSGISSTPLAEYALAGYLHFSKHLTAITSNFQSAIYERPPQGKPPEQITKKTVGIIGFGSIGKKVANVCRHGFDMKVIAITRTNRDDNDNDNADVMLTYSPENLKTLLSESNLVVLSLPKTSKTNQMIGKEELEWMRNDAVLVNVGRGNAIDEDALAKKLSNAPTTEEIRGLCAALDVYQKEPLPPESPLWNVPHDRILLSPHSADQTNNYWKDTSNVWLRNAEAYAKSGGGTEGVNSLKSGIGHIVDLNEEY